MAPGSGPEPAEELPTSPPDGWQAIVGELGILKLSSTHDAYPPNLRDVAEDMDVLAQDAEVAAAVERLNRAYAEETEPDLRRWFQRTEQARQHGDFAALQSLSEEYRSCIARAVHGIVLEARSTGPAEIPIPTRFKYLAERVLPPFFAAQVTEQKTEPFVLMVNRSERVAVPILLQPGEVLLKFSGLRTRDVVAHIAKLLTAAKRVVGTQSGNKGGRNRLEDNPRTAEMAKKIADLRRREFPDEYIARQIGLLKPGETSTGRNVKRRLDRLAQRGEALREKEIRRPPPINPSTG